ncbi:hypothetical protein FQR65_LT09183 [Abscondita terminalis]|nr:hypothetical protein FQR65_LT09183 [Abscondita terminalis]
MNILLNGHSDIPYWIGLACTLCAIIIAALGSNVKKRALEKLQDDPRSYENKNYFLQYPLWWLGIILMVLGEIFYIAAYIFAPVSLVTPLSSLVIVLKAVICKRSTQEVVNVVGQTGCLLCVLGSVVIVIRAPKIMFATMENLFLVPAISITTVLVALAIFTSIYISLNYYSKQILVYVIVSSAWGSLTIIFYKFLGICIKQAIVTILKNDFKIYLFLIIAIFCCVLKEIYMRKSETLFNPNVVESLSYTLTVIFALLGAGAIFEEWNYLVYADVLEIWLGFVFISTGLFLLHWFSTYSMNWASLNSLLQITENGLIDNEINFD